ncbi:hypothetical protein ACQPYV_30505 [Micromonospora saelicesensis]|uniref:hypothetical protein n=1 Tax=Micromonospora saelicesensis TaxID=285676 RepID=UPI003D8C53EC
MDRYEFELGEGADDQVSVVTEMLATWSRQTMADLDDYLAAVKPAQVLARAAEVDDPVDDRDLRKSHEKAWVCGYRLLMSAFQRERWQKVHRELTGVGEEEMEAIRVLRNAIEHLDDLQFEGWVARPKSAVAGNPPKQKKSAGPKRGAAINHLPGAQLFLGSVYRYNTHLFGLIPIDTIKDRARRTAYVDLTGEERGWAEGEWEPSDIEAGIDDR